MQPEMVNNQITQNLNAMSTMISMDSTMFKGLYQNVLTSLYDLQGTKKIFAEQVPLMRVLVILRKN